jgi:hypothetical protein
MFLSLSPRTQVSRLECTSALDHESVQGRVVARVSNALSYLGSDAHYLISAAISLLRVLPRPQEKQSGKC